MPTIEQRLASAERELRYLSEFLVKVLSDTEQLPSLQALESQFTEGLKLVVRIRALKDAQSAARKEERNRELVRENEVLRSNSDHLSSENASLARQVESMAMRIESLAEELAKPEDVRLREVLDALDGRAVIFDGLGARVGHLLDEMDEWIGRAGEAERMVEAARRSLSSVAESMTEHAYQELASALESPPRIAGKTADFDPPGREYTVGDALGLRRDR